MSEQLPIVPLTDTVIFPDSMTPLLVDSGQATAAIEAAATGTERVILLAKREGAGTVADRVRPSDLYRVGTEALVHRMIRVPDGTMRALVQGMRRVRVSKIEARGDLLVGSCVELPDTGSRESREIDALSRQLLGIFSEIVEQSPYLPDELRLVAANVDTPVELSHLIASALRLSVGERQKLLNTPNLVARLRRVLQLLSKEREVLALGTQIQSEVHDEMSKTQREWYLRQQLRQIQEALGEDEAEEVSELRRRIAAQDLPKEAQKQADRELGRLARTPEQSGEYGVIRGYLEWLADLPWNTTSSDNLDLPHARSVLDDDHFGLERVKERVLDHLAVSSLRGGDIAGQILCFVGPPGVGKTSLGKSIARALNREFVRISVGGVRDESEIRGHRRTYIGSMPGSILRSLRDAGTKNPVFMIDEIDKMGSDWRGDPSSAMLEVLDPEQNGTFRDHFLDVPFDLSHVLFVCTANRLDTIPPALRDRMEIIRIEGYTEDEKLNIAQKYLVPRQRKAHGLKATQFAVPAVTLRKVIHLYTREAGVRALDRQVGTLARKAARFVVEHPKKAAGRFRVTVDMLVEALGPVRYRDEAPQRTRRPGVATGLAVTGAGGDVLFIEAAAMPGSGKLIITGQVGDVMEESVRAAVSWIRSTDAGNDRDGVGEDPSLAKFFAQHDLHVHIPAGAVPKDGPSAGVALATALTSLYHGVPIRSDVAMTGEITLTGDVLAVGGIKEKALAAHRAGMKHVIMPEQNEGEVADIPAHLAQGLVFHLVDHISQVLAIALTPLDVEPRSTKQAVRPART